MTFHALIMNGPLTPDASVVTEFGLTPALLPTHHARAAEGHIAPDPVMTLGDPSSPLASSHDFFALEAFAGFPHARLVGAQAAAQAVRPPQDVQLTLGAVRRSSE